MRHLLILTAFVLGVIAAGGGGYVVGNREGRAAQQSAVTDAQSSKTLIVIRRDIQLLTEVRKKKYDDLVKDAELWTILQLAQIDPTTFAKGSVSERIYPQTLEMVNAYRKQFPDTMIDPDKDLTIAKAFPRTQ